MRIYNEKFIYQLFCLEIQTLGYAEQSSGDLAEQVAFRFTKEWVSSSQHDEDDDSKGPYVSSVAAVLLSLADLRAHVVWRPAACLQLLARKCGYGEAEIDDFEIVPVVNYDVVELQVSVHYRFLSF